MNRRYRKIRRVRIAARTTGSGESGIAGVLRRKLRGQALIIISLCTLLLIACVGLAIDGGSMYTERRQAQNASDGAAMAGASKMLSLYQNMVVHHSSDVNGSADDERAIYSAITTYASKNGIQVNSTNLQAYFVNDQKQIVTAALGQNGCGYSNPCQVGRNNLVPWVGGAKGIVVTSKATTSAYFMQIFGQSQISSSAQATAYMGVATNIDDDIGLLPVGFFTSTTEFNSLIPGNQYVLIQGSTSRGSGNWGYIDFNSKGNPANVVDTWLACGFRPSITTQAAWDQYCPSDAGDSRPLGPTAYWTGMSEPLAGEYTAPDIKWPADPNGWWLAGSSGTTNSSCQFFNSITGAMLNHSYWIPVFDRTNGEGGNNTKFHLISVAEFRITSADIVCHKKDVTPTPGIDPDEHWSVIGVFLQHWSPGASGTHGDVRHTSSASVFLEP